MFYNEINLINTNYILPYSPIVENIEYCTRDEIADPYKLECLFNIDSSKWSVYTYNNKYFYTTLIPWKKTYKSYGLDIKSHYFRVLTQDPSIFKIDFNDIDAWFDKNYAKMFLITHVILSHTNTCGFAEKKYVTYKKQLISLNDFAENSKEEMNKILENKCYTICNGIILFLALHRLNYIDLTVTQNNLEKLAYDEYRITFDDSSHDSGDDSGDDTEVDAMNEDAMNELYDSIHIEKYKAEIDYIQNVSADWEELYYAFPLTQLCDFPIYYTYFGPNFANAHISKLFQGSQDIHIINNNNINTYMFPISAQFPYFNISNWNVYLNNNTKNHDIIHSMDDIMNHNIDFPDITNDYAGILQMFYNTNSGWDYWQLHKNTIIGNLLNNCKESYKFLRVAFHYYKYESEINKTRIVTIWEDLLDYAFNNNSNYVLHLTCLLYIYYSIYTSHQSNTPPLLYIQYILRKCENTKIELAHEVNGIAHNQQIKQRIQNTFPNTIFEIQGNIQENQYSVYNYTINTSLYKLIKANTLHYEYLKKIIITRLLCLKHFAHTYTAYYVVTDYMRHNRYLLY